MFIVPINSSIDVSKMNSLISRIEKAGEMGEAGALAPGAQESAPYQSSFRTVFEGLINDVEQTEAIAELDSYNLSIGALEDPHTALINAAKAELTLSTMVQIRNKVLDAYSEIMRINL